MYLTKLFHASLVFHVLLFSACTTTHGHKVSASVPDKMASSPAAAVWRTGKIDPIAASVPRSFEAALFAYPQEARLRNLVTHLTSSISNPYRKIKIIHDWIALHIAYDTDAFVWGRSGSQEPYTVLKNKRTTCGGFARLFKLMSDMVGIETRTISGISRKYIRTSTGSPAGHVWSAVRIDGLWHIVDVTGDNRSGYENGTFSQQAVYRDGDLFIHPRVKRLVNLANKPEEQFVSPSIDLATFLAQPLLYQGSQRYGIRMSPESISKLIKTHTPIRGGRYLMISRLFARPQRENI